MPTVSESDNLYVLRPDLAKEWHPTRNGHLGPQDVTPGSKQKVWWICVQGHEWEATIRSRSRGETCPICTDRAPQIPPPGGRRREDASRTVGDLRRASGPPSLSAAHYGHAGPYAGMELRKSMRYERAATVMVEKPHSEIIGYAQLKNFSADGIMLLSDFALGPGEFIKIRLGKPLHSSAPSTLACRVVWCRDLESMDEAVSRFGAGLSF